MKNLLTTFILAIITNSLFAQTSYYEVSPKNRLELGAGYHWKKNNATYDNGYSINVGYSRLFSKNSDLFVKGNLSLIDCYCQEFPYCPKNGQKFNYKIVDVSFGKDFRINNHYFSPSVGLANMFRREYDEIIVRTIIFPNGQKQEQIVRATTKVDYQFTPVISADYKFGLKPFALGIYARYFLPIDGSNSYSMGATISHIF